MLKQTSSSLSEESSALFLPFAVAWVCETCVSVCVWVVNSSTRANGIKKEGQPFSSSNRFFLWRAIVETPHSLTALFVLY